VNHLAGTFHTLAHYGILEIDDALGKVLRFLTFTKAEANHSFTTSLFICHTNSKVAGRIADRLHPVVHGVSRVDEVNLGDSEERGRATLLFVGKDNQEYLTATLNAETAFL
jgi:hypothetical protein